MSDEEEMDQDIDIIQEEEQMDTLMQQLVVKTVRTVLALNNSNTLITRNQLLKYAWDTNQKKVNFNEVLNEANKILFNVYGYNLKLISSTTIGPDGKARESKTKQYILVNALDNNYLKFIQETNWNVSSRALFSSELADQRKDYRNKKEEFPSLSSDEQLAFSGLALTVVSLIIVSNNHISEPELIRLLEDNFGLDQNKEIDIIKVSLDTFLKMLAKADYVDRTELKSDNDKTVEYRVGRRAKEEFGRESFVQFAKIIYQEPEERDEFTRLVNKTLEPTFGELFVDNAAVPVVVDDE